MANYSPYSAGTAHLDIEPRFVDDFARRIRQEAKKHRAEIDVKADFREFERDLQRQLRLRQAEFKIRVTPDMDNFRRIMRQETASGREVEVAIDLDTTRADATLRAFTRNRRMFIDVDVNMTSAVSKLDMLRRMAQDVDVGVNIDTTGARRNVANFRQSMANEMTSMGMSLAGTAAKTAAITSLFPAAAASVGVLTTAVVGLTGAAGGLIGQFGGLGTMLLGTFLPAMIATKTGMEGIQTAAKSIETQFTDMKDAVSGTFEEGFLPIFEQLGPLLTGLTPGLQAVATGMTTLAGAAADVVTSNDGFQNLQAILVGSAEALGRLAPGVASLMDAVLNMVAQAAPVMGNFGATFGGMFADIGDALNRLTTADFSNIVDFTAALGRSVSLLVGGFVTLGQNVGPAITGMLNDLNRTFDGTGETLSRLGIAAANFIGDFIVATGPFIDQFSVMAEAATGVLGGALRELGPVLGELVNGLGTSLLPVLGDLGTGLTSLGEVILTTMGAVETISGSFLDPIIAGLGALKAALASDLGQASLDALASGFQRLTEGASNFLPPFIEALTSFGQPAMAAFGDVLGVVGNILTGLTPAMQLLADTMNFMQPVITALAAGFVALKVVPPIIAAVTGTLSALVARLGLTTVGLTALRTAFATAGGGAVGFGAALRAGAVASMTAVTGAARGLIGMLGGPWGIAFMAAAAAVGGAISANNKLETAQDSLHESSQALAAAQKSMWDSMGDAAAVGDSIVAQIEAVKAAQDAAIAGEQRGVGAFAALVGSGLKETFTTNPFDGFFDGGLMASDYKAQQDAMNNLHDAAERAKGQLSELNMTNEELRAAIEGGDADWAQFVARLGETSDGGVDALNDLMPLRDGFLEMQGDAARLGPEFLSLGEAIDVLSDSSSTAEQKISAVRKALQDMGLIPRDSVQLMFDFAESMDRIGESASRLGPVNLADIMDGGKLNPFNTKAQELNGILRSMADEYIRVAVNGGDVAAAQGAINAQLEAMAGATGIPIQELQRLAEQAGYLPRDINMLIGLQGSGEAQKDLTNILAKVREIGEPQEVRLNSDQAVAALREIDGVRLEVLDAEKNLYKVTVDNEGALEGIKAVVENWNELAAMSPGEVKLDLDKSSFDTQVEAATGSLGVLSESLVMPTAGLDLAPLEDGWMAAINQLGILDTQRPKPSADLDTNPLDGKAAAAMGSLDAVDSRRPKPVADANIDPLLANVTRGQQAIDGMKGKEVTVKFKAVYEGFGSLGGISTTGGNVPAGGLPGLPELASGGQNPGYRLPKTGPGTETVDGFMAFDRNMVPSARLDAGEWVINGKSSEKYDRELRAINAGIFPKLPGYAGGAKHDAKGMLDFVNGRTSPMPFPLDGAPYDWGNQTDPYSWGDCSGTASRIAGYAIGMFDGANRALRQFSTADEGAVLTKMGFQRGRGSHGDLRIGWRNGGPGGGHTATTLPDGTRAEMGGGSGGGKVGGRAAGHDDSYFNEHMFLPMFRWVANAIDGIGAFDLPGILGSGDNTISGTGGSAISGTVGTAASRSRSSLTSAQPRTWSEIGGDLAKEAVGGQISDALGIFGIPDQLPPFLQAYNMMTARSEMGEPTAWELAESAANIEKLKAQVAFQTSLVEQLNGGVVAVNNSPIGNAHLVEAMGADIRLSQMKQDLEDTRTTLEEAQSQHRMLVALRESILGSDQAGAPTAKDQLAIQRAENKVTTLEEQIARAETALGEAKGEAGRGDINGKEKTDKQKADDRERVAAAEDKLRKLQRDLDIAKQEADLAKEKFEGLSMAGFPDEINRETRIAYDPAGGAEQWRPMVIAALNNQGLSSWADDPAIVDRFIRQIDHESKGVPNVTQGIQDINSGGNEAEGLGQIAKSTWREFRDPSLPDDWHDPWANLNTMARYVRGRYGEQGYLSIGNGIGYSGGGEVLGPGGPFSDLINARLSHGEFVVRAAAAQNHLPLLKAINGDANFMQNLTRSIPVSTIGPQSAVSGPVDSSFNLSIVTQDVDKAYSKFNTFNRQRILSKLG